MEKEKQNNIEKLKTTRKLLDNTRLKYKSGTNAISLLNRGILYRNSLIENYKDEVEILNNDISKKKVEIKSNEAALSQLRNDYAKIVKASYRSIEEEYWLMYLLSSLDINQAYQRIKYIKYLNEYRRNLYVDIVELNENLLIQIDSFELIKKSKSTTLNKLDAQKNQLLKDKNQKANLVKNLKAQESVLLSEIRKRERLQKSIEEEIRKMIEEEARKARESNRINTLTPQEKIIDKDFSKNKGGLPWPSEQGIITGVYGKREHPVLPGIIENSIGIDITTPEGSKVRAVFKGEVKKVVAMMGANYTIIVQHGNYRTVYVNIVNVRVKVGDMVETKEYLGNVGEGDGEGSILHFQLWNKRETLNPETWLSK